MPYERFLQIIVTYFDNALVVWVAASNVPRTLIRSIRLNSLYNQQIMSLGGGGVRDIANYPCLI